MLLCELFEQTQQLPEDYTNSAKFEQLISDMIEIDQDEFMANIPDKIDQGISNKRVYLYDRVNEKYLIYDDKDQQYYVFDNDQLNEHEMIWGKSPHGLKLKWRCTAGHKKGRIVPNVSDCGKPLDIKKREKMKITRANTKIRQARKAKKTKKVNPQSKLVARLNKARKKT